MLNKNTSFLNSIHLILIIGIVSLSFPFTVCAQQEETDQARELAYANSFEAAEAILSPLIIEHPDFLPAQLLRAYNFSWWRKNHLAISSFKKIIENHPVLIEPKIGLAYALLWAKDYQNAAHHFKLALELDPENEDALNGLGQTYLAQKEGNKALKIYNYLTETYPEKANYFTAMAQAFSLMGKYQKSTSAIRQAIRLAPENKELLELQLKTQPTKLLEVDIWGGYSLLETKNKLGFRLAKVFFQMSPNIAIFGRYDNSLSLDNIDFVIQKMGAASIWGGSLINWQKNMTTKIEVGQRFFENSDNQHLFRLEQIFYQKKGLNIRIGGFLALSPTRPKEWHTYAGINIPVNERFSLEPTFFYSKNKVDTQAQFRALVGGKFNHPSGFELTVGGFFGRTSIVLENGNSMVFGGYLISLIPINKRLKGQIAINRENGLLNHTTTISLGIKRKFSVK